MKNTFKRCALFVASSSMFGVFSASAANTFYQAGDLVLYFQKLSGTSITNTVYVDLGAATNYRGAAIGPDASNSLNFLDLNTTLTSAFGADWKNDTGLYVGLAGVYSTSTATTVVNGDVSRTLYVSAPRNSVGTIASADSTAWTFSGSTPFTTAAGQIQQQNNVFGDTTGTNGYNSQIVESATTISLIDENNPITVFQGNASQQQAFGAFDGGVQQVGTSGAFGTFGPAGSVEFALDLFRIAPINGRPNEINGLWDGGNGTTTGTRIGSYEGTVTVGSNGMVSFVTIPEPSSLALSGLAVGALVLRRRRSA